MENFTYLCTTFAERMKNTKTKATELLKIVRNMWGIALRSAKLLVLFLVSLIQR
jgi:hypothetical protein